MAAAPTTSIQTFACPACGEDIHTTFTLAVRDGTVEDGRQIIHVRLSELEFVGGCEHAERMRDEVTIQVDP
jgi:hypothetical protein